MVSSGARGREADRDRPYSFLRGGRPRIYQGSAHFSDIGNFYLAERDGNNGCASSRPTTVTLLPSSPSPTMRDPSVTNVVMDT